MSYLGRLLRVELAAQAALLACCALLGVTFVVGGFATYGQTSPATGWLDLLGAVVAFVALPYVLAVAPVVLVLAPVYTYLEAKGRATGLLVAACGIVLGVIVLLSRRALRDSAEAYLPICAICGVVVATALHLIRTWRDSHARAA